LKNVETRLDVVKFHHSILLAIMVSKAMDDNNQIIGNEWSSTWHIDQVQIPPVDRKHLFLQANLNQS